MNEAVAQAREASRSIALLVEEVRDHDAIGALADAALVTLVQELGTARRGLDALLVEAVGEIAVRDENRAREARVTTRAGAGTTHELVQRALLADRAEAARVVAAARGVERQALFDGSRRPARYAAHREVLLDGKLSLSGFLAVTRRLDRAAGRLVLGALEHADAIMAGLARGVEYSDALDAGAEAPADDVESEAGPEAEGADRPPRMLPLPEELARCVDRVLAHLDPDGPEPREHATFAGRFLSVGEQRDGLVPIRGRVVPEAAAQLLRISDAIHNPKAGGGPSFEPTEERPLAADEDDDGASEAASVAAVRLSRGQQLHDALATALSIAARADELPLLGGAAPTLVVAIDADAFDAEATGRASATLEGTAFHTDTAAAEQTACTGIVQRVLHERGRIVGLETVDRVFTAVQRRAIAWRDRECAIPGCHVPSTWTEIHHVQEHALGGPTHTDNGVALCFAHHRTLHVNGWQVRMREGRPEIRGPALWDPQRAWRRPAPERWTPTKARPTDARRT